MAKLRMAHASTHGARKPPGPTFIKVNSLIWAIQGQNNESFIKLTPLIWVIENQNNKSFIKVKTSELVNKFNYKNLPPNNILTSAPKQSLLPYRVPGLVGNPCVVHHPDRITRSSKQMRTKYGI